MRSLIRTLLAWPALRHRGVRVGAGTLVALTLLALIAPLLGGVGPTLMDSSHVNAPLWTRAGVMLPDGSERPHLYLLGTDPYGRDLASRVLHGARVSLWVGVCSASMALVCGGLLGMLAGYFGRLDAVLMRVMDGLMAIPSVLLAIALVAALGPSLATVIVAISVPEVPRVTRLVRSLVLGLREEAFVEAARSLATPTPTILWRHILPNALAPIVVQGTFLVASAILTESILSFLGLGLPPETPTWGNVMAEGRTVFSLYPGNVLFPALLLVPTVLAVNLLGDGLRDTLDPKFRRSIG
jgi:peptide/nickel transport system permease protein